MNSLFRLDILKKDEILLVIAIIFVLLIVASLLFFIIGLIKPTPILKELKSRTNSWWIIVFIFIIVIFLDKRISFVGIAFLSFLSFRELYSILDFRDSDRRAVFWSFLAIPINYYLAYAGWYSAFIVFIPVWMFLFLPVRLIIKGDTKGIVKSMASLQWITVLSIFCLSHTAFLLSLPEIHGFLNGGRGLLLFLVFMTEINDISQYVWGKILGEHKIIPTISENKTWEGLIGGIISTTIIGYFLGFLTPLSLWPLLLVSFMISVSGFFGSLVITAIKKDIGILEENNAVSGQKSILDRVDSLFYTAPVFFHLVYYFAY
ncbi:phosphatidate cytidylyltransferase [Apibacter raozihei]|uniref:phosphatidate cytidylyltransferase n=1 Tax=Apibacter TaxID=1778601 RepID=UPI000FE43383|nr:MULTISPECIES: phosphatidate cytidylyltransferase [Apibacter]